MEGGGGPTDAEEARNGQGEGAMRMVFHAVCIYSLAIDVGCCKAIFISTWPNGSLQALRGHEGLIL